MNMYHSQKFQTRTNYWINQIQNIHNSRTVYEFEPINRGTNIKKTPLDWIIKEKRRLSGIKWIVPADRTSTNIHPNNGIVERKTSGFTPNNSSLSLIGKANGFQSIVNVMTINRGLIKSLRHTQPNTRNNLHCIMFNPSTQTITKISKNKKKKTADNLSANHQLHSEIKIKTNNKIIQQIFYKIYPSCAQERMRSNKIDRF